MPSLDDLINRLFLIEKARKVPPMTWGRTPEQEQFLLEQLKGTPDQRSLDMLFELRRKRQFPQDYPPGLTGVRG